MNNNDYTESKNEIIKLTKVVMQKIYKRNYNDKELEELLNTFLYAIRVILAKNKKVLLYKFGTFQKTIRKGRIYKFNNKEYKTEDKEITTFTETKSSIEKLKISQYNKGMKYD